MNYYNNIKQELINNEIKRRVKNYSINRSDLNTYYNVGKMLSLAGKHYGEGIIKEYSKRLTSELGKGYSSRNLWLMLRFYELKEKVQTMSAQLSWSHYTELLSLDSVDKINYYIKTAEKQNLSVRQLRGRIKNKEYERLPRSTKDKLINDENIEYKDLVPDPIIIKNKNNIEVISEKVLQQLILEDIENFMNELGGNLSFVGSEYLIKMGNIYNYIDILLFNIEFNCYVVVELKIGELKKEHIGQVQIYMNYIDKNIKTINHNKTIGIIVCKRYNKYIIEYSSDERILATTYQLY